MKKLRLRAFSLIIVSDLPPQGSCPSPGSFHSGPLPLQGRLGLLFSVLLAPAPPAALPRCSAQASRRMGGWARVNRGGAACDAAPGLTCLPPPPTHTCTRTHAHTLASLLLLDTVCVADPNQRVKEAQAHLLCLPFLLLSRAENRKSRGSSRPWPALISQRAPRPARRRRHRVPPGPGVRTRRTPLRRAPALPRGPRALTRPAARAPSRTTMR